MAHRIYILRGRDDGHVFRLSLATTRPYNADFDGDEMNLHVPQDLESKVEMQELMSVTKNARSFQNSKPSYGLVQDSILGAYLMMSKNTFFEECEFNNLLMHIKYPFKKIPEPAVLSPRKLWTGKQLLSFMIPKSVNLDKTVRGGKLDDVNCSPDGLLDPSERRVLVNAGKILTGQAGSQIFGVSARGVIDQILCDEGNVSAIHYISDMQRVMVNFNFNRGFSMGIQDCTINPATRKLVDNDIANLMKIEEKVRVLEDEIQADGYSHRVCNNVVNRAGSIIHNSLSTSKNNLLTMVDSGSKGSALNVAQISGTIGQICLEGKPIMPSFQRKRIFSCFVPGEKTPYSKGFVVSPFIKGMESRRICIRGSRRSRGVSGYCGEDQFYRIPPA